MGISIDPKKLEKLEQLQSVLELLQNPEQYNRLMAEVNATLKQQKDVAARYASVEAAEEYLRESRILLATTKDAVDKAHRKLSDEQSAFDTYVMLEKRALSEREAAVKQREDKVEKREQELNVFSDDLYSEKEKFIQYRDAQKATITKQQEELGRMKKDLTEKAAKLARIVAE